MATLVAGIDSSTQSCKIVVRDADTGELKRSGSAPHPDGTEVDPARWWTALQTAITSAGGLDDVAAVSVAAQQHGMVCLDDDGQVVRPALLWNDTRSAQAAADLIAELRGGADAWAQATGSVPVASFTVTKLRWLAQHEPAAAKRTIAVCLPHDWLTWRLRGAEDGSRLSELVTDRGDASGTGYFSPVTGQYDRALLSYALGHDVVLPKVLAPAEVAGQAGAMLLGPGTGDNAAAALGLRAGPGDVVVSIGTSGVATAVSDTPTADPSGIIAGFADATGRYLPLVCTLNAARVLSSTAAMMGVDLETFSRLALSAPAGAGGLVMVPYLQGERTPNRPDATGALHGLTLATMAPAMVARAAVEGLLCGLADGVDALVAAGVAVDRVLLIGGGARSEAVRQLAPTIFGRPVVVPQDAEYVADGAARQAAWALSGQQAPPDWETATTETYTADPVPAIRSRYAEVCDMVASA
ncbi:MAG TPA: xylulokinase [Euzebya sp.]|nr:xylulokinase [Euzebya sp.]